MALKIRLRRMGRKKAPTYRIVVAESSAPRDGRFVENLGHYNPRVEPNTLVVDREKALYWIKRGAMPTETVGALLKKAGIFKPVEEAPEGLVAAVKRTGQRATAAAAGAAAALAARAAEAAEAVRQAAADAQESVQDVVEDVREAVTGGGEEAQGGAAVQDALEDVREVVTGGEEQAPATAEAGGAEPQAVESTESAGGGEQAGETGDAQRQE